MTRETQSKSSYRNQPADLLYEYQSDNIRPRQRSRDCEARLKIAVSKSFYVSVESDTSSGRDQCSEDPVKVKLRRDHTKRAPKSSSSSRRVGPASAGKGSGGTTQPRISNFVTIYRIREQHTSIEKLFLEVDLRVSSRKRHTDCGEDGVLHTSFLGTSPLRWLSTRPTMSLCIGLLLTM